MSFLNSLRGTLFSTSFELNPVHIEDFGRQLSTDLRIQKKEDKEIFRICFVVENILHNWFDALGDGHRFSYQCKSFFGRDKIILTVPQTSINPLENSSGEITPEINNLISNITGTYGLIVHFKVIYGDAVVEILLPRKPISATPKILLAIVLAIATWYLTALLPISGTDLSEKFFSPTLSTLMGLLKTLASLMIFTAITSGICSMKDVKALKHYGIVVLSRFQLTNFITAAFACLCAGLFWIDIDFANLGEAGIFAEIYKLLLAIIPTNIGKAFLDGNTLQIFFMAVCTGTFLLMAGESTKTLTQCIHDSNTIIMRMLSALCGFMPLIVYLCVTNMLLSGTITRALQAWEIITMQLVLTVISHIAILAFLAIKCRIHLIKFIKDLSPIGITALTTTSSIAAMMQAEDTIGKKYQIPRDFMNITVPMVILTARSATTIFYVCACVGCAALIDMPLSLSQLFSICLFAWLMGTANPPVAGGAILGIAMMFDQLGLPAELLAIMISLDFLADMLRTSGSCLVGSGFLVAIHQKFSTSGAKS